MTIPSHVAVIMDGNGRWAKSRFMPRIQGHRRGIESLRKLVESARRAGVKHLTVFAFSSENWRRPADEVGALMQFFLNCLGDEASPLAQSGVQMHVVGDMTRLSPALQTAIADAESRTASCTDMTLNICINYGGRWDIMQAVEKLNREGKAITDENIEAALAMPWAGPVDLMIRTGGEQRISNFLLWQAAYAELWFTEVLWPEFGEKEFLEAVQWYSGRERRFGKTSDQLAGAG